MPHNLFSVVAVKLMPAIESQTRRVIVPAGHFLLRGLRNKFLREDRRKMIPSIDAWKSFIHALHFASPVAVPLIAPFALLAAIGDSDFNCCALDGRFSETSVERTNGEVERGFRKRPLRADRLVEAPGGLVCAVFECPQKSRAV